MPVVSVLMPTLNSETYLKEAIDSILNQTFTDFEFIIVDDNSKDRTVNIIKQYKDKRIKLIKGKQQGIAAALNLGLNMAKGEYIARMDADDISLPERLSEQVKFMEENLEIGICGTKIETLRINEKTEDWEIFLPNSWAHLKTTPGVFDMLEKAVFCHPSVMFRKSVILKYNLCYNEELHQTEDQDLWFRACKVTKFYNIDKVLLYYREHANASSKKYKSQGDKVLFKLKKEFLLWLYPEGIYNEKNILSQILNIKKILINPNIEIVDNATLGVKKVTWRLFSILPILKIRKEKNRIKFYLLSFFRIWDIEQKKDHTTYRFLGVPFLILKSCKEIKARIDLFCKGGKDNMVTPILKKEYCNFYMPQYYKNPSWKPEGNGCVLEIAHVGYFYKKFSYYVKVIGDGEIEFLFRGPDIKRKGKVKEIWINYKDFTINGQKIKKEKFSAWHNKEQCFCIPVKDQDIITFSFKYKKG